jgi:hypothetical protein
VNWLIVMVEQIHEGDTPCVTELVGHGFGLTHDNQKTFTDPNISDWY